MANIYVASSWRNGLYPEVVIRLRANGHTVYDFRNPQDMETGEPKDSGFAWSKIDPDWETWTPHQYREALKNPIAQAGYESDMAGLDWADTVIMVQPCGRSASWEAGYASGQNKHVITLLAPLQEPELMYSGSMMCTNIPEVLILLEDLEAGA